MRCFSQWGCCGTRTLPDCRVECPLSHSRVPCQQLQAQQQKCPGASSARTAVLSLLPRHLLQELSHTTEISPRDTPNPTQPALQRHEQAPDPRAGLCRRRSAGHVTHRDVSQAFLTGSVRVLGTSCGENKEISENHAMQISAPTQGGASTGRWRHQSHLEPPSCSW